MSTLYAINGAKNWSQIGSWSATGSGGASSGTTPTQSDPVVFDAGYTGTMTVDTATCLCNNMTCMAASNIISISSGCGIRAAGNITLFNGMTLTAADATSFIAVYMASGGSVALAPAAVTWGGTFWMYDNSTTALTVTLGANWTVDTFKITNASTGLLTLNTNTLTVSSLIPLGDGSGSTILSIVGSGHLQATDSATTHRFDYPITFTSGTPTIDDQFTIAGATARNFNYVGGTPSMAAGATLNVAGAVNWNVTYAQVPIQNMNLTANGTFTLGQNSQIAGALGGTGSLTLNGAFTLTVHDILNRGTIITSNIATKIIITGGTSGNHSVWSRSGSAVHQVSVQLGLLNNGDYIDIADATAWGNTGDSLVAMAGNHITHTGTFTIFPATATLTVSEIPFVNLNVGGSSGLAATMNSDLIVSGTLTQAQSISVSWTGAYDWHCATYNASQTQASVNNLTIPAGRTLYISTATNIYGAFGTTPNRFLIKSGTGGVKANIAYSGTAASCNISSAAFTDIAASPAISGYKLGTLTSCTGITSIGNDSAGGGGAGVSITNF